MDVEEGEFLGLHRLVILEGEILFGGVEIDQHSASYAPSLIPTDFSETLTISSVEHAETLPSNCNVDAVVNSAWNSLLTDVYKPPGKLNSGANFLTLD